MSICKSSISFFSKGMVFLKKQKLCTHPLGTIIDFNIILECYIDLWCQLFHFGEDMLCFFDFSLLNQLRYNSFFECCFIVTLVVFAEAQVMLNHHPCIHFLIFTSADASLPRRWVHIFAENLSVICSKDCCPCHLVTCEKRSVFRANPTTSWFLLFTYTC